MNQKQAYADGWNAWPQRLVRGNPYTSRELREAWERGKDDRRIAEGGRHKTNAGDADATIERLSRRPIND